MVNEKKYQLRERILTLLRSQREEERLINSLKIAKKLYLMPEYKNAQTILFYASFDGEVDTFEMMKQAQTDNKTIALPYIDKKNNLMAPKIVQDLKDLKIGCYGIAEPSSQDSPVRMDDIDLVVVPGIAFDKLNNRLGRGGGYYDRFLAEIPTQTPTVGLAFDFQMVDQLRVIEPHDQALAHVLSN